MTVVLHPLTHAIASRLLDIAHRPGALQAVSEALTRLGPSAGDAAILNLAKTLLKENPKMNASIYAPYKLRSQIKLNCGTILKEVEISESCLRQLVALGDEMKLLDRYFNATSKASIEGTEMPCAGRAEYKAMLAIISDLTSLGRHAGELSPDDVEHLAAAVMYPELRPGLIEEFSCER